MTNWTCGTPESRLNDNKMTNLLSVYLSDPHHSHYLFVIVLHALGLGREPREVFVHSVVVRGRHARRDRRGLLGEDHHLRRPRRRGRGGRLKL